MSAPPVPSENDPVDDLRSKLDTASLLPRGCWKQLWQVAGAEFALPARALVDRLRGRGGPLVGRVWLDARARRDAGEAPRDLRRARGGPR